jgi:hypothetical protein
MYFQKVSYRKTLYNKICFLLTSLRSMTKVAGSGSISERHGSADPDPHQNVMDPEHCLPYKEKKAERERGGEG